MRKCLACTSHSPILVREIQQQQQEVSVHPAKLARWAIAVLSVNPDRVLVWNLAAGCITTVQWQSSTEAHNVHIALPPPQYRHIPLPEPQGNRVKQVGSLQTGMRMQLHTAAMLKQSRTGTLVHAACAA